MIWSPIVTFEPVSLAQANEFLVLWGHKMGACNRGNARGWSHALFFREEPVGVCVTATLIRERVGGGAHHLTRASCIELARLCAARPGICRVVLRLWREFVFPDLGYQYAMSYQDAALHSGNIYRFDGWQRVAYSRKGGVDTRTGRQPRDKWIWQWPPLHETQTDTGAH